MSIWVAPASKMTARTQRIANSNIQREPIALPIADPTITAPANGSAAKTTLWPEAKTPASAAAEFTSINGGDKAAVFLGDALPNKISIEDMKTPPPTPVMPDPNPVTAPASNAELR
jgi:hypothetical protein